MGALGSMGFQIRHGPARIFYARCRPKCLERRMGYALWRCLHLKLHAAWSVPDYATLIGPTKLYSITTLRIL
jgi:hypothetical protein